MAIFQGAHREGDRLVVQKLAEGLGVSPTPVREALVQLAGIGLVKLLPHRGAVCRQFGPRQLREMYQIRCVLEAEATRNACGRLPEQALRELRREMIRLGDTVETDPQWFDRAMAADVELHELITRHCENDRLADEIGRYDDLMQAIRRVADNFCNVQLRALNEHIEIIDALLSKDREAAALRMSEHIDSTASGVEKVIFGEAECPQRKQL
ncbi:MAG: GntR family transcriptional regulator [Planctomycetes bacterium]|nr:GntR family transcriptional regulator [Planctomycetota bacterium]